MEQTMTPVNSAPGDIDDLIFSDMDYTISER